MLTRLLLASVVAVAMASAQRGGGGMGGDSGGMGGMGGGDRGGMGNVGMMSRPSNRMDLISQMLNLNKDQKKQVKSIMDDGQKDAAPVRDEIVKSREAIAEAVASGKKGDELKPLETTYAAAAAKMHVIELSSFAKIYQILEADQQAKAGQLYGMMSGVFHGKYWTEMN